jgi:UDPglucose 6-dehydrogenase
MKISVIGSGYVGLVTGACLADVGNHVMCLDLDDRKIAMLSEGRIPIFEPGLKELIDVNVRAGRLSFTSDIEKSAKHGKVQFIAVGTPPSEDGSADLKHVLLAAENLAKFMDASRVIVNKSTVPVGTATRVQKTIENVLAARGLDLDFSVVSNPEFLKEGAAIQDFMRPDRIIVGAEDDISKNIMRQIYAPFERNRSKLLLMDIRSAELTKYAANAMLATRISFMNEMALMAEKMGADIDQVRRGIGSDPRIGSHFLYAGCGYGGSCFPKDVNALIRMASASGLSMEVISAAERANARQKLVLSQRVMQRFGPDLRTQRFAIWGLAFKPDTDDMREAPSITLINELLSRGATVNAYDPIASTAAQKVLVHHERLEFSTHSVDAVMNADALIIVTEWKEFRSPDLEELKRSMKCPVIFDGRNILDPALARSSGFEYYGIGRP